MLQIFPEIILQFSHTILYVSEVLCGYPDKEGDMSVQVLTRSIGGIAQYSCPRGQYMVGNGTRTCLKKGTWSGTLPACKCEFRVLQSTCFN